MARRMLLRLAAALALLSCGAIPAHAAPDARFTVTRTSGIAPLAVLFDAEGTIDPAAPRPFHELKYEWDFGDPDSGSWTTGSAANRSKNHGLGPITGHVFDPAPAAYQNGRATFTVTLTVTNAQGESATATQTIAVTSPDAAYSGTATTCVSASGSFAGCPTGARRTTTSSFPNGLENSPGSRTLFRRGETFQGAEGLVNAGSAPSQIGVFGAGSARPVVSSQLGQGGVGLVTNHGWTITGLEFVGTGGTSHTGPAGASVSRVTIYNVAARGFDQCGTWHSPSAPSYPREIAVVDFRCTVGAQGTGSAYFGRNVRSLFMGLSIDVNQAPGSEFAWRSVHLDTVAIQHSFFTGTTNSRPSINFRACAQGTAVCTGPQERVVLSQNHIHQTDGTGYFLRFCGEEACNYEVAQTQSENFLIEGNYWSSDYTKPGSEGSYVQRWIQTQGRDVTIRNNVLNLATAPSQPPLRLVELDQDSRLLFDRIHVLHNTFYLGSGWGSDVTLCTGTQGSGKRCQGNLLYAPGILGDRIESGGGWQTGGNRMDGATSAGRYTGNPFVSTSFDALAAFKLSGSVSGGSSPVDAAGATGVLLDIFDGCRTGLRDAGAHERGATPCSASGGGGGGGLQPPAAPILLP